MRIALCAPFMAADLLEQRIKEAAVGEIPEIDEYNDITILLLMPNLSFYNAVWIALSGSEGLDAVRRFRQEHHRTAIVWMSDMEAFSILGYSLEVSMFLMMDSPQEELRAAIQKCRNLLPKFS